MCNSNATNNSSVRSCIMSFPHISLSSQNCNSLNISTECDKQLSKVVAISSLCTNIIFLSDIRLGANASHVNKLEKLFLTNTSKSYKFFYNSSKSKRGVGMLVESSMAAHVTDCYKDPEQNILGLNITIDGTPLFIVSIYGPN